MSQRSEKYGLAKNCLLTAGLSLIRSESFAAIGINQILKKAGTPRGSFYHYFDSKEAFGIAVLEAYHSEQISSARSILNETHVTPLKRLQNFFEMARTHFVEREFSDGCLMCNLSTELGDSNPAFQTTLKRCWTELSGEIASCISQLDKSEIGLEHVSDIEAADWLLNAWSGALTRMKATKTIDPLNLFLKLVFKGKSNK